VLCIPQESTIAYNNFIKDVIKKLSPQGLPSFGSLLLIIVATNPNGQTSLDAIYSLISGLLKTTDNNTLSKAIAFLKLVSEVPDKYKKGDKRVLLLQAIFEGCHNRLSIRDSKLMGAYHNSPESAHGKTKAPIDFKRQVFDIDFRTISLLGNKFLTVDDIIERIAGLPSIGQLEIDLDDPLGDKEVEKRDFVDDLIENQKTFAVGSLIRWLWSGLNIPVHSSLPSLQPLGGISDLTNKGDYDKLLISEFAYDDLAFLSRLANNEALYIHREVPPAHNNLQRIILIDVTLKNWGTPKTIAFAIMLAIANHPKTDIACNVFILGANQYYPISIESIDTIIEALQIVEESLHPAISLELFLNEHNNHKRQEVLFITESSTLKYPAVQKVMNSYQNSFHYLFLTDFEGNIDIYKKQNNSKRHVQHLKLALNEIWKKGLRKPNPEMQAEGNVVNFPILLKDSCNAKKILLTSNGEVFKINSERSILLLYEGSSLNGGKGWDIVYQNLPIKTEYCEIGRSHQGHHILLLYETKLRQVVLINLFTGESKKVEFTQWKSTPSPSFIFESDYFVHRNFTGIWRIHINGTVDQISNFEEQKFQDKAKKLIELSQRYPHSGGVLKNVEKVAINKDNQLVLNTHVLTMINRNHVKWKPSRNVSIKYEASKISEHLYQFENGNIVEINRSGMIILKSKDLLSDIYIPTSIDVSLGLATNEEFAGNVYYHKEPFDILMLQNAGSNKTQVANELKDRTSLDLMGAKQLVDNAPCLLKGLSFKESLQTLKSALENAGATMEITSCNRQEFELKSIDVPSFYEKYIAQYIYSI
jgi:ribosomal protein L7/L12